MVEPVIGIYFHNITHLVLVHTVTRISHSETSSIIGRNRLIRSGTMEEVKGDDSLEDVFLELEGESC